MLVFGKTLDWFDSRSMRVALAVAAVGGGLYLWLAAHTAERPLLEAGVFGHRYTWYGIGIFVLLMLVNSSTLFVTTYLKLSTCAGNLDSARVSCWAMPGCVAGMALVWAIIPGNAVGESLWWYECRRSGVCSYFDTGKGILGILPGVAVSMAAALLTVLLWLTVGRATRRRAGQETMLGRVLYLLSPAVCSIGVVVNRMVPVGVQTVFAVFLLALVLGEIVPNELGGVAYVIRTRGSAYWLWPFAVIITWETLFCTMMVVALIYGL